MHDIYNKSTSKRKCHDPYLVLFTIISFERFSKEPGLSAWHITTNLYEIVCNTYILSDVFGQSSIPK
jgi:hypothetical protein